jgi:hypothetical protein
MIDWLGSTLLNFLTTDVRCCGVFVSELHIYHTTVSQVIHTQIQTFHSAFRDVKSLDGMIQLHDEQ